MIRWTKLLLIVACLWSIYWGVAAWGLHRGVDSWFAEQQRQGWQAEHAGVNISGFPLRHTHRITAPVLADPGTGTAWRAGWLELSSPAIWPGHLTVHLPDTPQRVSYFDDTAVVQADGFEVDLQLAPGLALEVERLQLVAEAWSIQSETLTELGGQQLSLGMVQTDQPELYQITGKAIGVSPSALLRQRLAAADGLPERLETVAVDMTVRFDASWDRNAIELRRPQPRQITLQLAEARWGPMRIKATGTLNVDETGLPEGELALQVENWQDILRMAETTGALPSKARAGIERVLRVLAGLGGNHRDLDLTLTLSSGYIALGPLPLGPAPRIILR
ncbi:DUF2125 domain-containing protein [Phaeobacter porticola]|uniref:DUF2125 domain-containing protein n=1 Tax=Phaeobacter porticola TaxID=1844006 RepID=A0A1L3I6R7_9RHOB|nr:DUF2125 domain-containing protein [Phaeobacter porticola]APG47785.1 putative protein in bacteria [Phaeobacter porticola]